jgi:hypothetical protein
MYTELDLIRFAAYCRHFGNPNSDEYKIMADCLYDWKQLKLNGQNEDIKIILDNQP